MKNVTSSRRSYYSTFMSRVSLFVCVTMLYVVVIVESQEKKKTMAITFDEIYGDHMVLQQAPYQSRISGDVVGYGSILVRLVSSENETIFEVNATVDVENQRWDALLKPIPATSSFAPYSIVVASADNDAKSVSSTLEDILFGDVWFCAGQSNMALPVLHTMSRNKSVVRILNETMTDRGVASSSNDKNNYFYDRLRLFGIAGNMNPDQPWITAYDAAKNCFSNGSTTCPLFDYSSTCWYFGESLLDELGRTNSSTPPPPVGLVHTAFGGSTIEQWLDNATIAKCANSTIDKSNGMWHEQRVLPFVNMTLKGWIWYQGENDMHGVHGNSAKGYGYGCLATKLVETWRELWSGQQPTKTTDPSAPFGLVTLASSGSEGGNSMGTMRWAQTANYGVLPNEKMPRVFSAQAFDLDDPWSNISCYSKGCCPNNYDPNGSCDGCEGPRDYCANLSATNYYMGPIHPRDKKIVGSRLAQSCVAVAYGVPGAYATGPTLRGCGVASDDSSKIALIFDGDVNVKDYQHVLNGPFPSKTEVLTNASLWCMQTTGRGGSATCIDDGSGRSLSYAADFDNAWTSVHVASSTSSARIVLVDIGTIVASNQTAFAIRYGWEGACCDGRPPTSAPCPVAACPMTGVDSGLPVNPFVAKIVRRGTAVGVAVACECVHPQVCDAEVGKSHT